MTFGRQAMLVVFCLCAINVWGGDSDVLFPGLDDFDWGAEVQRLLSDEMDVVIDLNFLMNPRALSNEEQNEVVQYFRQFGFEEMLIQSLLDQVVSRVLQQGGLAHDAAIRVLLEYFRVPNVDEAVVWVFNQEFIEGAQSVHAFSYGFLRSHFLEGDVLNSAMLSLNDYLSSDVSYCTALRASLFTVHEWYRNEGNLTLIIRIYQRYMDQGFDSVRARLYSCLLTHGANPRVLGNASEWFDRRYTDGDVDLYFEAFFGTICRSFSFSQDLTDCVVRQALLLSQVYPFSFDMFWVAMFHSLGVQGDSLVKAWAAMRQHLRNGFTQWIAFEHALVAVLCDPEDFYRHMAILQEGYVCSSEYDRLKLVFGLILAMRNNARNYDRSVVQGFAQTHFLNLYRPNGSLLSRNES
tara:strand:+ start:199 stop:1419 length:1221 start_codon:yes stop_codon:yes gene_type:complete